MGCSAGRSNFARWFIDANDSGAAPFSGDILSIGKVPTLTGAPTAIACFPGLSLNIPGLSLNIAPPIVLDADPGAVHISPFSTTGSSAIKRYRIDTSGLDPATDSLKMLDDTIIPPWSPAPSAKQPNARGLDAQVDGRFQSASIQSGGQLWNVHTVTFSERPLIRLYKFSTHPHPKDNSAQYVTLQTTNGNDSLFNASVATAGGANSPIFVTASRTIPSMPGTGNVAHVVLSNPSGDLSSGWQYDLLATSPAQYEQCTDTSGKPIEPFRWGDYSATVMDPDVAGRAWSINQIAKGPSCYNWATETGPVDIAPPTSSISRK